MNHVQQKHRYGCGPACLAMIAGMGYDEVVSILGGDFDTNYGMTFHDADDFLVERGYAISRRWKYKRGNVVRTPWPPEPWAEVHLVQAQMVGGNHFLIWQHTSSGPAIFDPNRPIGQKLHGLSEPCYVEIGHVAGIHKLV